MAADVAEVGDTDLHGRYVVIRVEDSGVGIPPEMMDTLFLAFSQVDTSSAREYGGSGL